MACFNILHPSPRRYGLCTLPRLHMLSSAMGMYILPSYTTHVYSLLPLVKISYLSWTGDLDTGSIRLAHWLARFGAKIMVEMSHILNPKSGFCSFQKMPNYCHVFAAVQKMLYFPSNSETALRVLHKSLLIRLFSFFQTHGNSHILQISPISSVIWFS